MHDSAYTQTCNGQTHRIHESSGCEGSGEEAVETGCSMGLKFLSCKIIKFQRTTGQPEPIVNNMASCT